MRRRLSAPLLIAGLAAALSCDDPAAPHVPVPGWIEVGLISPAGSEAALVLVVTGPAFPLADEVAGASGDLAVFARRDGTALRVAVFGPLAGGPIVRFPVADTAGAAAYDAALVEVAAPDHALREDLAGYALVVSTTAD